MRVFPPARLAGIMTRALARRGVSEEHARWVAEALVSTSLRGVDTHGVRLFPTYLKELDGGRSKAWPELRWSPERGAARRLDAGGALGIVAGMAGCREALRLARLHGVGAVSVGNSNHFGAAAVYTLEMARAGVVGLAFTNSDALVAPFGGIHPFLGTNPLSVAAQGVGDEMFCADFATSQVSYSRVKSYRERGEPLSPGWAVTADGEDAARAAGDRGDGGDRGDRPGELPIAALLPLGGQSGHKGEGLGMIVQVLCALLAGTPFDHELSHLYDEPYDEPRQVAHLFLALDVAAFEKPEVFQSRLSGLLKLVREQQPAPGAAGGRVQAPGDPERQTEKERRREGVPLNEDEYSFFLGLEAQGKERQSP